MLNKRYGKGWRNESYRHSLAAKHIKTSRKKNYNFKVPISVDRLLKGRIYPVSPELVERRLSLEPDGNLRGLRGVRFVNPRDKFQKGAWGQYLRGKREVLIFSQPFKDGLVDGQNPVVVEKHIKDYVIPHEVGHHRALYLKRLTDKNIKLAEARADANVVKMDPDDRDVKKLIN